MKKPNCSYKRVKTGEYAIVSIQLFRGDLKPEEFKQAAEQSKDNHISCQRLDDKAGQKRIRSGNDEPFHIYSYLTSMLTRLRFTRAHFYAF